MHAEPHAIRTVSCCVLELTIVVSAKPTPVDCRLSTLDFGYTGPPFIAVLPRGENMSVENKQKIEGLYEAFGRGDVPYIMGALDRNVEWWEAENFIYADKNPYRGPESVLAGVFGRLMTKWDGFAVSVDEVLDAGDSIVGLGHYTGKYRETGREVRAQFAHVFKLRDGRVVKFQQYTDTAQFLQATTSS